LLRQVFVLYRQQFRKWFAITAPTSIVAAFVVRMCGQQVSTMLEGIPRSQLQYHFAEVAETVLLRFVGFFLVWLLAAFVLGAIAASVGNLDPEDSEVWRHDSHQRAREHFGGIFLISLITFGAALVGEFLVGFVVYAIIRVVGWKNFSQFTSIAAILGSVAVASLLGWFGMAIPLIIRGNTGTLAALKRSVKLSDGYELFLFLLVIQLVAGSYESWYAAHYCLMLVIPSALRFTSWYGWAVYLLSILASAAVEPPMFIGFSLLAYQESGILHSPSAENSAQVEHLS
jgi:MFS family permease